jgi:anti-sigma factor RsiW
MTRWQCRRYQSWLVDHADGVLDASRQQRIERHLAGCLSCRADLEALRNLPQAMCASAIPDPGDTFWLQQRQAIGRSIRNLPAPRSGWSLDWLRDTLRLSLWRYPIAATAAVLLALSVYRFAEAPRESESAAVAAQLAALDTDLLLVVGELADAVTPADGSLHYLPQEEEIDFAALAAGDLVGPHTLSHVPDETELSDAELEGVDDLIGNIG